MRIKIQNCLLELVIGDITAERVDAIVNAANRQLAGGGGVDGAIHRAGGPLLMEQLRENYPQGCPVGRVAVTEGGQLATKFVFHAVGPVWRGGRAQEEDALRNAYRTCLELAEELNCKTIAFPAISTGVYGYPLDLATTAALEEIRLFLQQPRRLQQIRCILFNEGIYGAYCRVLESWESTPEDSVSP